LERCNRGQQGRTNKKSLRKLPQPMTHIIYLPNPLP
jgi:hypothetical protein